MKLLTINSASLSQRCSHQDTLGRQCRSLVSDARSGLCPRHLASEQQKEATNVYAPLIRNSQGLQTAQGINYTLSNLYELLAKNRVSSRRASVLAYINSLLLRTLPQIDADNKAGIIDPTKPPSKPLPVPDEAADPDSDSDSETGPDLDSDSNSDPDPVNTWDPSIPEPDPQKKPS
jgi:hypothetical protein